jgi:hypothetical protein
MPPKRKAVSEEPIQSEPTGAAAKKLKKVSAVTIEHCKSWYASLMFCPCTSTLIIIGALITFCRIEEACSKDRPLL